MEEGHAAALLETLLFAPQPTTLNHTVSSWEGGHLALGVGMVRSGVLGLLRSQRHTAPSSEAASNCVSLICSTPHTAWCRPRNEAAGFLGLALSSHLSREKHRTRNFHAHHSLLLT